MNILKKKVFNRAEDFIQFHDECCKADSIVLQLKKYCELKNFDEKEKENAVLLYSICYSIPTTIVLLNSLDKIKKEPLSFWKTNKEKLIFQSDRKYVKMNDKFVKTYFDFNRDIFQQLKKVKQINLEYFVKKIEKCFFFARFSAFLFLEAYSCVFDKKIVNNKIDWLNGSTVTSGMLNVLGRDNEANIWDKQKKIYISIEVLDKSLNWLLSKATLGKDISVMETNLCAYRKLFKGSRYLGYYSDRALEELNKTIKNFPEYKNDLELLFEAREKTIPEKYLGEKNNWTGIRKELKKNYIKTGDWRT